MVGGSGVVVVVVLLNPGEGKPLKTNFKTKEIKKKIDFNPLKQGCTLGWTPSEGISFFY